MNGIASDWWPVTGGGVLQDSILGPGVFNIFINHMHAELEGILRKFADSGKLGGADNSLKGRETLQRDHDK